MSKLSFDDTVQITLEEIEIMQYGTTMDRLHATYIDYKSNTDKLRIAQQMIYRIASLDNAEARNRIGNVAMYILQTMKCVEEETAKW